MPTIKRHTVQKTMTYQAVCRLADHPTAEEIYAEVKLSYPSISLGTVYRNLSALCEEGLLLHIELPDSADRYDHNVHFHNHITCSCCSKVCDVALPYDYSKDESVKEHTGFFHIKHNMIFRGICPECMVKNNFNTRKE